MLGYTELPYSCFTVSITLGRYSVRLENDFVWYNDTYDMLQRRNRRNLNKSCFNL